MMPNKNTLLLFVAAAALRLALFLLFPSLQPLLTSRVEISTPITSFKRLQEGLFLYTHNISPYDGGVYNQAPLFLPLFSLLPDYRGSPIWTNLVYVGTDLLSAYTLAQIADSGESASSRLFTSPRRDRIWSPFAVAGFYLFNPLTVATCIAQPTSVFTNCAILQSIATAISGNVFNSILALGFASYLSMYPVLLAPPLALLAYDRIARNAKTPPSPVIFTLGYATAFAATAGGLLLASYAVLGFSWEFLASTYGVHLLQSDLTPNVGLWWYFFVEMFDSFRDFFLGVFWLHMASYVGGITLRIRKQPLFAVTSILGVFAIFKPYPSISDTSLYFALIPLYRHVFPFLRYSFVASAVLLYAIFLGPAFHHLWIYAGSGNANFFYAITLVWSLGLTLVLGDTIWAVLRDEFEVERPEVAGKDVRQT